ncbi:DUF5642 family protein [Mycolicibacterium sp. 120266]|uniref:DUF5642 family protein n=1 Tax=Mycolicibacterium sp. 120266 TaxID=3090601 RepID=UPI00299DFB55|nr:DUF5642 family protein [Mycolicibacterium sp. 120266]MDX1870656.1 DUF5642 family protein [Mycolicibacterium sp. 120266]
MLTPRAAALVACAAALTACSAAKPAAQPDIAHIVDLKSQFGPEFHVTTVAPTGIDSKMLAAQPLPPGVTITPPDCAKLATGLAVPPGVKGNMAATTAEGNGNRFIVIAMETSDAIGFNDPGPACQKVDYAGAGVAGQVQVVESPKIDDARVLGTHRVLRTMVNGAPRTGELFNYVASFGTFVVMVTANPLVEPNKPVVPVDTGRARDLLTKAVADVRG